MKTKVVQIGNSFGFILPKPLKKRLSLKKGDELILDVDDEKREIVLRPAAGASVDPAFAEKIHTFTEKYRSDLEKLAE